MVMPLPKPRSKIAKALAFLLSSDIQRGDIAKAARSFGVDRKTLTSAWSNLCKVRETHSLTSNDRVVLRALHLTDGRGATSHRLLSDEQEEQLIRKLRAEHPNGFDDGIILATCRNSFYNLRNRPRLFSRHFLARFKHRAGIRRSKLSIHQRTLENHEARFEKDVTKAIEYIDKIWRLAETIPPHLFINVDECPSYVRNLPSHALHFVDAPAPWVWIRAKERDAVSVLGAVTGDGHVLNTGVIAKGTTSRCEAKYRTELPRSFVQHTPSGLTTTQSFIEFLQHVVIPYTRDRDAVLIVDAYPAHRTRKVKEFCKAHHMKLVFVPDRATSVLQPLDVGVFGTAKFRIYRAAAHQVFEVDRDELTRWEATAACVRKLNESTVAQGRLGWNSTFPFWPDVLQKHGLV